MANLAMVKNQFFDASGKPLSGGKVWTYVAGTLTPLASYTDATGLVANTNPVILDARGECSLWLAGSYKIVLMDALNVTIYTQDVIVPYVQNAVAITGGTINSTVIGGVTPAAISGTTGTFTGAVSGTTGTFSGAISGTTGTFSGALSGTAISGTSAAITGPIVGVTLATTGYTVATLPVGTIGQRAYVTDATASTFLATLTGGGAIKTPVFHNGTAWVAG